MVAMPTQQPHMWSEPVQVQRGDIWQLGKHRLMCGDATNTEDVARLFGDEKAQAVITDPPYGMLETGWDTPVFSFIEVMASSLCENATVVAFCSLPFGFQLHAAMVEADYQWRWDAVWIKGNGGVGTSKRRPTPCHEHLFAYARKGVAAHNLIFHGYDAGEQMAPWQRKNANAGNGQQNMIQVRMKDRKQSSGQMEGIRWLRSDFFARSKNNLPACERTPHPTQKPLEVVEKLVLLLSNADSLIYDPFSGSGTTLIAGQRAGRTVYGMELSPEYCSDIIQRWQEQTGQKAVRA